MSFHLSVSRARRIVLLAVVLMMGLLPSIAQAQPPAPGKPITQFDEFGNLIIVWEYDMDRFPDSVFAAQIEDGPVIPLTFTEVVQNGNFLDITIEGRSYPLFLLIGSRVRIYAFNFLGASPPSPYSDPIAVDEPPAPDTPPAVPTLNAPEVTGSTVRISWTVEGTVVEFDIEAIAQANNQTFNFQVPGDQRSMTVPGVPNGNFLVRIRSRNARGASDWTPYRQVLVGVVVGGGDLQVTLTWNSTADMDLHVIEPNGTHVYFANRNGVTARLDRDDTNGFGPENIFVNQGAAVPGVYQVYIVHFSRNVPTTSTIGIRINAGTPNERFTLITRNTGTGSPSTRIDVANVNVLTGTVSGRSGWSAIEAPVGAKATTD